MPAAHFIKVSRISSWSDLLNATQIQESNNSKPLNYNVLVELNIPLCEFNVLTNNLSLPNPLYLQYAFDSIADKSGRWNCIVINCQLNNPSPSLILFTAGRTFPLYVAISSASSLPLNE